MSKVLGFGSTQSLKEKAEEVFDVPIFRDVTNTDKSNEIFYDIKCIYIEHRDMIGIVLESKEACSFYIEVTADGQTVHESSIGLCKREPEHIAHEVFIPLKSLNGDIKVIIRCTSKFNDTYLMCCECVRLNDSGLEFLSMIDYVDGKEILCSVTESPRPTLRKLCDGILRFK